MDNINFIDVFNWTTKHLTEIIIFCSIFVEITPIKFNPISLFLEIFFKSIRSDMNNMKNELKTDMNNMKNELKTDMDNMKNEMKSEIDQIKDKQEKQELVIKELIKSNEMGEISRIRWEIIEFSNSINNKQLHIRDEYRHVKDENKRYHTLIEKYKLENGIIDEEMEKINKHYRENKDKNLVYF